MATKSLLISLVIATSIVTTTFRESKQDYLQNGIRGTWTDGSSSNANFVIRSKTIYYVDQMEEFRYTLNKSIIKIAYADYTYRAKVMLRKDTLIFISGKFGPTKYWRFKQ